MTNQLLIALAALHSQPRQFGIGAGAPLSSQYLRLFWLNSFIYFPPLTHLAPKRRQEHFVFKFNNGITAVMTTFIGNVFVFLEKLKYDVKKKNRTSLKTCEVLAGRRAGKTERESREG